MQHLTFIVSFCLRSLKMALGFLEWFTLAGLIAAAIFSFIMLLRIFKTVSILRRHRYGLLLAKAKPQAG